MLRPRIGLMPLLPVVFVGLLALLSACSNTHFKGSGQSDNPSDAHSAAQPSMASISHIDLELKVDFTRKRLVGQVRLDLKTHPESQQIVLDTRNLEIESITDASGGVLKYTLGQDNPVMGRALTIELPQGLQSLIVHYHTTPKSRALQWLEPSQTSEKRLPFMFTQGESLLTREWIPIQDSPALKVTYRARVIVPKGMNAIMSADAENRNGEPLPGDSGSKVFRFEMKHPIPPYLIALAVGDIGYVALGPRTGVYAEKSLLPRAKVEFSELEAMLTAQESIMGPFVWGHYNILILPPSFPYRGMENPLMNFMNTAVITGDKALVPLAAHEMSHSWAGNLVTNANWNDFWLNEGLADYFENRTVEILYGRDRALMRQVLMDGRMKSAIAAFKASHQDPNTRLHTETDAIDPDDIDSEVPYGKGAAFMRLLESHIGRARLDAYLKGYFKRYAYQSIDTEGFERDLQNNLIHHDPLLESQLHLKDWFYGEGIPENMPWAQSPELNRVEENVSLFAKGAAPSTLPLKAYSTEAWQWFLQNLPETVSNAQLRALDEAYGLSRVHNAEVLRWWFKVAIDHHYEPAFPAMITLMNTTGCQNYILPLYRALMAAPGWGPVMARKIYADAKPLYHQITRNAIEGMLNPPAKP